MILKFPEIIFFSGAKHIHYTEDILGVKKVSAPLKNPMKCLIKCFAREKKINLPDFFKISGTLIVKFRQLVLRWLDEMI
jgi:hypothetical protein